MLRFPVVVLFAIAPLLSACGGAEEDLLAGTWSAGKIELVLTRKEQAYDGKLIIGGKEHALHAEPKDEGYVGSFKSSSSEFPVQFQLVGDVLKLESGGTRHELKRKVAEPERNPLAEIGNPLLEVPPATPPANQNAITNPLGGE